MKARTQTGTKAEAKAAAKCYRHTTKIKLTARKGPGTSYKEVGNISKGVSVCVNEIRNGGKYKECGGDNRWAKLSKPFGGRWVAAVCLRWAE
ncbi:hypothetical protein [Streptomyces purpurogeneiscleroticus]|uniref:hypothetical protein n=1 Tax=Streptomyces purpurogeneiscleroticus TaxID=68259 RepID=UPI001CBFA6D3|nr:hypothetical protein [Streptomyces purpurogeneiscleroticus]